MSLPREWWSDARHYQIAALSILLGFNLGWIDFGAQARNSALAIAGALAAQWLCTRYRFPLLSRLGETERETAFDARSPLITGLSLSLLLRADEPWLHLAAAVIAIGSKFVLRLDGKHIFNPAGFAIVALLIFAPHHVWISPGQWGSAIWFTALVAFFAILVLSAARRADVAIFFLAGHAALLLARAAWLGDPVAIPLHQLQSGSLLIFAFFMISDPRTTPDARLGRLVFALAVALLGHYLAFFLQMRPALYVALIALSPLTILIDRVLPAARFSWRGSAIHGASQ
jgi:Na+-transporting NADH:ubiquinone oxidoreductase subunit NqrB